MRIKSEKLAYKVAETLEGLCPALVFRHSSTAVWHGCDCKVSGSSCTCVRHLRSECNGGKWKELAFLDKARAKADSMKAEMLDKVLEARKKA